MPAARGEAAADVGAVLKLETDAAGRTVKLLGSIAYPPSGFVTITSYTPGLIAGGHFAAMRLGVTLPTMLKSAPPTTTLAPALKRLPIIDIALPDKAAISLGLIETIVGI
jgi:hypothetical protein